MPDITTAVETVRSTVQNSKLCTNDLIVELKNCGIESSFDDLMRFGKNIGIGLARDGHWYQTEDNEEVTTAYASNNLPFYMEQYFRNR